MLPNANEGEKRIRKYLSENANPEAKPDSKKDDKRSDNPKPDSNNIYETWDDEE